MGITESGRPFSVELQVSSPFQVRIQMQEEQVENEQVVVEKDVIIRRVIVTPTSEAVENPLHSSDERG